MSYKDLEAEIKAWADLEAYSKKHKEDAQEAIRAAKRQKLAKKQKTKNVLVPKSPAPKLERPTKTYKRVTLEVRPIHHRKWGEVQEVTYEVCTMSDTVAEVEAIKQAREDGLSFDSIVLISTFEK